MIRVWNEMTLSDGDEPEHYVTGYVDGQAVAMRVKVEAGGPLSGAQAAELVASRLNTLEPS